ncbi:SAM-dependent methyltransferase [Paenibacillus sp. V4I3]|nr:SAM-dependent methyltransferase [Paenibacillus sp. V4I3]
MKQNKYDDLGFFEKYSEMPRSIGGLNAAGEWPVLRTMIPALRDKRVLDLGCGFGWHCQYAREQQARSVVGVVLKYIIVLYQEELLYFRLNIRSLPQLLHKTGIMVRRASDCTGLSTTTRKKVNGKRDFWTMMSSNIIGLSLPMLMR